MEWAFFKKGTDLVQDQKLLRIVVGALGFYRRRYPGRQRHTERESIVTGCNYPLGKLSKYERQLDDLFESNLGGVPPTPLRSFSLYESALLVPLDLKKELGYLKLLLDVHMDSTLDVLADKVCLNAVLKLDVDATLF